MKLPSIKTLTELFAHEAKAARQILENIEEDRAMRMLGKLDGYFGKEIITFEKGGEQWDIRYLNSGDSYNLTLVYNGRSFQATTLDDAVQSMERQGWRIMENWEL